MYCLSCKGKLKTIDTRDLGKEVVRRIRICTKCNKRFLSEEKVVLKVKT